MHWFRMWAEAVDDEKLRLLAFEDRWHFVALLCLKAKGILDEPDTDLRRQKICVKLGLDSLELETVMKRLVTVGLVSHQMQPVNWGKRQFLSDSSTNRVRAFRERQRNVSETPSDTDNRIQITETEKKPEGALRALVLHEGLPKEEWAEWLSLRRHKRWPCDNTTLTKQLNLLKRFDTATQREMIDQSINCGWRGIFALKGPRGVVQKPWKPLRTAEEIEAEELLRDSQRQT